MKEINSTQNAYIKDLAKLKEKKYRDLNKQFIVEGYHLVFEAYKSKRLIKILATEAYHDFSDIDTIIVNKNIIEKLSSTKTPQNIIGICEIKENNELIGSRYLLLDNINDPGNLGTLIRSSVAFDMDTIILGKDCVDLYNDKVLRSTQGAIFKINIVVKDLSLIIPQLKNDNVLLLGTSLKSTISLNSLKNIKKYALVLGNEANGVKEEILSQMDENIKIDINDNVESLNVAVAGSIIMHFLNK